MDPLGLCSLEEKKEYIHGLLAAAGLVPLLGIIPDLLDTLLYLLEGDLSNAGLSAVAMIPCVGQLSRLGQYLMKLAKYKSEIMAFGKAALKYAGDVKGLAVKYGGKLKKWATNTIGVCFIAGTQVYAANGMVAIEDIQPGDYVLSRNDDTGEVSYQEVVRVFVTPGQQIYELKLIDENDKEESIGTTQEHPFWVKARGWIPASELLPGDEIFTSGGGWLKVASGTWLSGSQTVYNFEVKDFHTYFVGSSGAWVHNSCKMELPTGNTDTRFIGTPDGKIIDTQATPPGRYRQPEQPTNKSTTTTAGDTDILIHDDHGAGVTHTHEIVVNRHPNDPSIGNTKKTGKTHDVTYDEVRNIENGTAKKLPGKTFNR